MSRRSSTPGTPPWTTSTPTPRSRSRSWRQRRTSQPTSTRASPKGRRSSRPRRRCVVRGRRRHDVAPLHGAPHQLPGGRRPDRGGGQPRRAVRPSFTQDYIDRNGGEHRPEDDPEPVAIEPHRAPRPADDTSSAPIRDHHRDCRADATRLSHGCAATSPLGAPGFGCSRRPRAARWLGAAPPRRWAASRSCCHAGGAWAAGVDLYRSGDLTADLSASGRRIAIGYGISIVIGVAFGVLIGSFRSAAAFVEPQVALLRYIPRAPSRRCSCCGSASTRPRRSPSSSSAPSSQHPHGRRCGPRRSQGLVNASYTLGAGRLTILRRVLLPYSWPGIIDVARVNLAPRHG